MCSKQGGWKRHHAAENDVCACWLKHWAVPACPPIDRRCDDGNVVDESMGYPDFGLAGTEAIALDERHEFGRASHDGRDGEGNGKDREVVAEEGEQLGGELDVKRLV